MSTGREQFHDRSDAPVPPRPRCSIRRVAARACVALCLGVALSLAYAYVVVPRVIDHSADWEAYLETGVGSYLKLPAEAVVLEAKEYPDGRVRPVFSRAEVTFRLPPTKPSADWARQIAEDSGLEMTHARADTYFDLQGHHISYSHDSQTYDLVVEYCDYVGPGKHSK